MAKITKKPIHIIGIDKSSSIRISAYGMVLFFIGGAFFSNLMGDNTQGKTIVLIALLVFIVTIVVHELIHGFFFWVYGGKPKYGVGLAYFMPYAYASSPGQRYSLSQMSVVSLSPLFLLSAISLALAVLVPAQASYWAIIFIANFSGAVGDMWLISRAWKFAGCPQLSLVDLRDGVAVYATGEKADKIAKKLKQKQNPELSSNRFITRWLYSTVLISILTGLVPIILNLFHYQGSLLIGPKALPLIEFVSTSDRIEATFTILPAALGGLIYSALFLLFEYRTYAKRK